MASAGLMTANLVNILGAALLSAVVVDGRDRFGSAEMQGPPSSLNWDRPHVSVFMDINHPPDIKLYAKRSLSGDPVIVLNERGLFVGGQLACSWPGGRFDPKNEGNMVLGYARLSTDSSPVEYEGCPSGLPVISTWGDGGRGAAALYLEVLTRHGSIIELRYQQRSLWLDLNSLQGGPNTALGPSFQLRKKDTVGWEWVNSRREMARRNAARVASLMTQPSFARFLKDVRSCLTSKRVPDCFVPFVHVHFNYPEATPAGEPLGAASFLTPQQFTRYLWETKHPSDDSLRLWDTLVACFTSGRPDTEGIRGMRFETSDSGFVCEVDHDSSGWKLTYFFQGE